MADDRVVLDSSTAAQLLANGYKLRRGDVLMLSDGISAGRYFVGDRQRDGSVELLRSYPPRPIASTNPFKEYEGHHSKYFTARKRGRG